MPRRSDNPAPLGEIWCPIGGEIAYVFKARGKRASLYSRCSCCGCNQGNGPAFQKQLSKYVPVGTLTEKASNDAVCEPEQEPEPEPEKPDFEPGPEPEQEPEQTEPAPPGKAGLVLTLAGITAGLIAIANG